MVWFYLGEAGLLHDTLWAGVGHRKDKALAYVMLRNRMEALAACDEELELMRTDAQRLRAQLAGGLADAEYERTQRLQCETKKKGLFWKGASVGAAVVAVLAVVASAAVP